MGKGYKATLLRMAAAETVSAIWRLRNDIVFAGVHNRPCLVKNIVSIIVARCHSKSGLFAYVQRLDRDVLVLP